MNADDGRALIQERLDLGRKFLRQILELRAGARLHPLSGPHQFFSECGQHRALAAMGFDQRNAEKLGPLLDQIPDVAIGKLGVGRRTGELSGVPDLVENSEHNHDRLRAALLAKSPDGFDVDVQHYSPIMKSTSYRYGS